MYKSVLRMYESNIVQYVLPYKANCAAYALPHRCRYPNDTSWTMRPRALSDDPALDAAVDPALNLARESWIRRGIRR